jgi:hypothetical protein
MMKTASFAKTGNFWIDNGIVGLFKILKQVQNNIDSSDFQVELKPEGLKIETTGNDEERLLEILNSAKDKVVQTYLKQTGLGWVYNTKGFETYRKNDFKKHLKPFFTGKRPDTEGGLCTPTFDPKKIKKKDRVMTADELSAFTAFSEANINKFKEEGQSIEERGFLGYQPKHEMGDEVEKVFFEAGKKRCHFSGESYKIADTVTGMDFPFLTGKSGEQNFASFLSGKPSISAKYSYVSLFAFYNLYYQINELSHYFVLYDSNLKSLSSFVGDIQKTLDQTQKADFCNFETYIIGSKYEKEALFNFLLSVYKQVKQQLGRDIRREVFTKTVFVLSNDGNIFRHVEEYSSLESLFHLFDSFAGKGDEKNYFEEFIRMVQHFNKKIKPNPPEYDTTWRNRLCSNILSFSSITSIIERFLGEVKMKEESGGISYLDKILEIYIIKTQPNMKAEMVETCKSLGNRIGRYCRENEDKGILFSIRNAKSRNEFLTVLSETQFRTEVLYSEDFFKDLPDNAQWEEYKSLVSIFAMNSFLYRPDSKKTTSTNQ